MSSDEDRLMPWLMIVSSGRVCYYRVEPSGFATRPFEDTSDNKFRNTTSVFWGSRCAAGEEFLLLPEHYSTMESPHTHSVDACVLGSAAARTRLSQFKEMCVCFSVFNVDISLNTECVLCNRTTYFGLG